MHSALLTWDCIKSMHLSDQYGQHQLSPLVRALRYRTEIMAQLSKSQELIAQEVSYLYWWRTFVTLRWMQYTTDPRISCCFFPFVLVLFLLFLKFFFWCLHGRFGSGGSEMVCINGAGSKDVSSILSHSNHYVFNWFRIVHCFSPQYLYDYFFSWISFWLVFLCRAFQHSNLGHCGWFIDIIFFLSLLSVLWWCS